MKVEQVNEISKSQLEDLKRIAKKFKLERNEIYQKNKIKIKENLEKVNKKSLIQSVKASSGEKNMGIINLIQNEIKESKKITNNIKTIYDDFLEEEGDKLISDLKSKFKFDICFIVEIIDSTVNTFKKIIGLLNSALDFLNKMSKNFIFRYSLIFYDDWTRNKKYNFVHINFTQDYNKFKNFINELSKRKIESVCKDVNGALKYCLDLNWSSQNKFIFHLAENPSHGMMNSDKNILEKIKTFFSQLDIFPNGAKDEIPFQLLFEQFVKREIVYKIASLSKNTETMNNIFREHYHKLQKKEDCFRISDVRNEKDLCDSIKDEICRVVSFYCYQKLNIFKKNKNLEEIKKHEEFLNSKSKIIQNCDLVTSDFTKDNVKSLQKKLLEYEYDLNVQNGIGLLIEKDQIKYGGHYKYTEANLILEKSNFKVLMKQPYEMGKLKENNFYYLLMKINTIAKHLAHIFTQELSKIIATSKVEILSTISFIENYLCKDEKNNLYYLEANLNSLNDNPKNRKNSYEINSQMVEAFSHWTFEFSNHRYVLTNLKGEKMNFKNPGINTFEQIFVEHGDLGVLGISLFLHDHKCNKICKLFKLSNKNKINEGLKICLSLMNENNSKLRCMNIYCGNSTLHEKEFCEHCDQDLDKTLESECWTCEQKFKGKINKFIFLNKEIICEKCNK